MAGMRYGVAMSLDGYIAGPNGETDWIVIDPELDFAEIWAQFDTLLMGRRTYEAAVVRLGERAFAGMKTVVVSRTFKPAEYPGLTILPEITEDQLQRLRAASYKDIWVMGGGELFRVLLAMHAIDQLEVNVLPVMLGGGVPLLPAPSERSSLKLTAHRVYRATGTVRLTYEVCR